MTCYVYIIQNGRKKGSAIKIGVADNPEKRLDDLQTGNPVTLVLITKIPMVNRAAAYDFESWLHKRFSSANVGGEWFDSKRCGLKRAFGVWNKVTKHPVDPEALRRSSRQRQLEIEVETLRRDKVELKRKISELERDIEEYLDSMTTF